MKKNHYLQNYKKNYYSQFGEDGIVNELLIRLKKSKLDFWCVEFGAWDGIFCSNTCNLIKNKKYNAILFEADKSKFKELESNYPNENVIKLCEKIGIKKNNTLDYFLGKTKIPKNFDFLSIDIDGMDYYVFESINFYKPKIVCIEYNPSIPIDVNFVQEKNFNIKHGSSALSIFKLAEKKGYKLVAATNCNLFFVKNSLIKLIFHAINPPDLKSILDDTSNNISIFFGYDGTLFASKQHIIFPWHDGFRLDLNKKQYLPKYFRKYPGDWGKLKLFFFKIYRFFFE